MPADDIQDTTPIVLPIEDVLDLHLFRPKEIPDLLSDYFSACRAAGIFSVRVIHGKGTGTLKKRVHSLLNNMSEVAGFEAAPIQAGGWGATIVHLNR